MFLEKLFVDKIVCFHTYSVKTFYFCEDVQSNADTGFWIIPRTSMQHNNLANVSASNIVFDNCEAVIVANEPTNDL